MLRVISQQINQPQFMTIEEVKQYLSANDAFGYFKYVKIKATNEYRFCDMTDYICDHKILANGEEVQSAGMIKFKGGKLKTEGHSMSLKIGPDAEDYKQLPQLFNMLLDSGY